jgi:hypothetical protein
MTATTETSGTATADELVQVAPGLIAEIAGNGDFTVDKLLDLLVEPDRAMDRDARFPDVPAKLSITDAVKARMRQLPSVFAKVSPETRRELEPSELTGLSDEINVIDALTDLLSKRREQIAEYARVHMDVEAERLGKTEGKTRIAEGKAAGHWLLAGPGDPHNVTVPGYEDAWQQRYVKGSSTVDAKILAKLVLSGAITQAEFNAMTRTTRVLDKDKMAVAIRKNPGRFLQILASITKKGAPSASLYPPKKPARAASSK